MRENFGRILRLVVSLLLLPVLVLAQADDTPNLSVTTTFPGNEFSLVKNGQPNRVVFSISNPPSADRVLNLEGVTGAFLNQKKEDGQRGRIVRNMTTTTFKSLPLRMVGGKPVQVPYDFYSEFKPQPMDVEFRLLVTDAQTSKKHNLLAYRGTVTVIEPPKDLLDLQLLSLYALLVAGVLVGGYYGYKTYFPSAPKKTTARKQVPQATAASVAPKATPAEGFDADWIPEQHLRSRKGASPTKKGKGK